MFLKKIKRILAYSLLLAMLLSILPPTAFAAESETRWNPIALEDITSDLTIAITMSKGDTTYVLPTSASSQPLGEKATISGTQLLTNGDATAFGWTISDVSDGYHITNGDGSYLYTTNTNNGVRIGKTPALWIIQSNYLYSTNTSRYLGVYTTSPDWRCYTSINTNIKGQTLGFWVLDNGTSEPTCEHANTTTTTVDATCTTPGSVTVTCDDCGEVTESTETLATGHSYTNGSCETCGEEEPDVAVYEKATSIQIGDVIFLVYETDSIELNGFSTTSTIYGLGESYSGTIAARYPLEVVQGNSDNTFAFHKDGSYLCWKSGNSLSTSTEITANSSWTVTFDDNGNAVITNVADTTRVIFWNATSPRFACYTKDGQKAIQIYKLVSDEEEPETPTGPCEHQWDNGVQTTVPTCTEEGVKTFTCTLCGHKETEVIPATGHSMVDGSCTACGYTDPSEPTIADGQYVIAANVNGTYYVMSNVFDSKISGTAVTITDGKIPEDNAEGYAITLTAVEGGYTISDRNDNYLKYSSSTNFAETSSPYTWIISKGTNGTYRITSQDSGRGLVFRAKIYCQFGGYAVSNITATGTEYYDVELIPVIAAPDAKLTSRSISLNGNIAVNFYMSLSDKVAADPNAYMLFKQEGKEGEVKVSIQDCVEKQVRDRKAYVFTYEVAAKEMTDTITAQFFYGDTSTEKYPYSVKTYADNQRENMSDNESLMNLLEAMLRYGAASQIQFDYHTERLADADMEPVDYSDVTIDGYPLNLPQGTDLVTFAGATLLLKSETTLRYFLRVDPSVENLTVTYNDIPLEILTRSGLHYVDVKNISAPALDMEFTITVNDGVQEANITYSPLTYCQSIRSKDNTDAHKDVCAALYLYNQAANDFFKTAE